jgi:hypothetical protein
MSTGDPIPAVIFRDIPDFPGYRAGDDGSIWSCRTRWYLGRNVPWHRLRPNYAHGYLKVDLYRDNKSFTRLVHRLVLEAFVGPPPSPEHECRHRNGVPDDCRLSNLEWGTPAENAADRDRHGTTRRGSRHSNSKVDESIVRRIREMWADGMPNREIRQRLNLTKRIVYCICKRKTWRHI